MPGGACRIDALKSLSCALSVRGRVCMQWRQPQLQPLWSAARGRSCMRMPSPGACVTRPAALMPACSWRQAVASAAAAAAAAPGGDAPRNTPALLAAMSDAVAASEAFAGADCGAAAVRAAAVAVQLGQHVQAPQEMW